MNHAQTTTSRLQTLHRDLVPLLLGALSAGRGGALLVEAEALLANPEHDRLTCACDACDLFRRIRNHLRADQ